MRWWQSTDRERHLIKLLILIDFALSLRLLESVHQIGVILEYVLCLVLSQAKESNLLFSHVRRLRAAVRVSVAHLLLIQIFYESIILRLTLFSFILVLWHGLLVMQLVGL